MSEGDEDYIYDEVTGDWMPASQLAARIQAETEIVVRDAVGNVLQDGDQWCWLKTWMLKGPARPYGAAPSSDRFA